jgi:hypothetical protein
MQRNWSKLIIRKVWMQATVALAEVEEVADPVEDTMDVVAVASSHVRTQDNTRRQNSKLIKLL